MEKAREGSILNLLDLNVTILVPEKGETFKNRVSLTMINRHNKVQGLINKIDREKCILANKNKHLFYLLTMVFLRCFELTFLGLLQNDQESLTLNEQTYYL